MSLPGSPDALPLPSRLAGLEVEVDQLRETGRLFFDRGWSVGTSSNYSVVVNREPLELLITASGKDKGRLTRGDFVRVDDRARPLTQEHPKSSAETWLHVVAAAQPDVGAVLHTHSVWGTLLSDIYCQAGGFTIEGYEMLKGLAGIQTHDHSCWVEVFGNTQDIPKLAAEVQQRFEDPERPLEHGYLISKHGLYTWGRDLDEARRHVEIFEFLFQCVAQRLILTGTLAAALP